MENYYLNQLHKLTINEYPITIQATDSNGEKTKYLSITLESIPAIIDWLEYVERKLKEGK